MFAVFFTFFLVHRERGRAERKAAEKLKEGSVRERLRECEHWREREREGESEQRCSSIPQQTAEDCRCVCDCTAEEEEEEEAEGEHARRLCRATERNTEQQRQR